MLEGTCQLFSEQGDTSKVAFNGKGDYVSVINICYIADILYSIYNHAV